MGRTDPCRRFLFRGDGTGTVHGMTADDWMHGEWIAVASGTVSPASVHDGAMPRQFGRHRARRGVSELAAPFGSVWVGPGIVEFRR